VKKGMIVLLKGFPCKVIEVTTSKTGKHGHAKANITGIDIFTGQKKQDISPTSHNMIAPFVTVSSLVLLDITEDGYCNLLTDAGETREDLKVPPGETGEALTKAFEESDDTKEVWAVITKAMDSEIITDIKVTEAS